MAKRYSRTRNCTSAVQAGEQMELHVNSLSEKRNMGNDTNDFSTLLKCAQCLDEIALLLSKWVQGDMKKTIHSAECKIAREWPLKVRQKKGLTQRAVAALLDVSHSWVGKI